MTTDQPLGIARQGGVLRNIKVAMRDGVKLSTTVYLPLGEGPFPAVLVRTAYNRVARLVALFPRARHGPGGAGLPRAL